MWIIEERTLKRFWRAHVDAKSSLVAWLRAIEDARFTGPVDVKRDFAAASFVSNKVVFNIAGNKYRLIVRFQYARKLPPPPLRGIAHVRFIGTHADYDRVDVAKL